MEGKVTINSIIRDSLFPPYKNVLTRVFNTHGINVVPRDTFERMKSGAPPSIIYNELVIRQGQGKSHASGHYPKDEGELKGT